MASVQDKDTSREAKEMYELKQRAMKFYAENGVPQKMEEILNSMFYDNPDDAFGHLANYFETFAKPAKISKVTAREVVDSRGLPTVQTDVFCTYKNNEQRVCSVPSCTESYPSDAKVEDREAADAERQKFVTMAIEHINSRLGPALAWHEPTQQQALDTIAYNLIKKLIEEEEEKLAAERKESGEDDPSVEQASPPASPVPSKTKAKSPKGKKGPAIVIIPDEPREKFFCGCNALSATSQAVCVSGAKTKGVPLYQHIAEYRYGEVPSSYHMPLPMVSILASGKGAPGKLNCVKEFMVVPKPGMPFKQSMKYITEIYNHCTRTILSKPGDKKGQPPQRVVTDSGALCTTFDRPEQGLDMIQEAMTHLELTPGEDFHIAINCAGHEMFDYDKGKYEVMTGVQKTADDLAEFWGELLGKYPSIIALIDPMRKQEKEAWITFCERLSEKCYIIGNKVYHRPGVLREEELDDSFKTSGIVLKMEHMNTLTDLVAVAKRMEDLANQIVVAASYGDSCETFLVDLAVGMNAKFLKLGGPCRGEKVAKLNRMLEIEAELEEEEKLEQWDEHSFPLLKLPTPPPPVEEGEEGGAGEGEGDEKNSNSDKTEKK